MKHHKIPKCLRIYMQDYVNFNVIEYCINIVINTRKAYRLKYYVEKKIFDHMIRYYKNRIFYDIQFSPLFLEQFDVTYVPLDDFVSFVALHESYLYIHELVAAYFEKLVAADHVLPNQNGLEAQLDNNFLYELYKQVTHYVFEYRLHDCFKCEKTKKIIIMFNYKIMLGQHDDQKNDIINT